MRERLVTMPTWALYLASTLIFLLPMLITTLVDDSHIAVSLIFFGGFSLVFGSIMTLTLRRRFRRERRVVGDVPVAVENAAHKAVLSGPVPTDPEVRAATLRLAEHRLGVIVKWRPLLVGGVTLATVSSVIGAFEAPWKLIIVAGYVPLMVGQWRWPKKLRSRIEELAEPQGTPTTSPTEG